MKNWYKQVEKVLTEKSYGYIDGLTNEEVDEEEDILDRESTDNTVLLDMQTANMLVTVAKALKPETRKKFTETPIVKAVDIGWKCVS